MSYDLRDDMLECYCGNSKYKHYYSPTDQKIVYYPNDKIINNKRCKFFYNKSSKNYCKNKNCNFQHIKDDEIPFFAKKTRKYILNNTFHRGPNGILGWNNIKSYNERDERRIKSELHKYIIEEQNYHSAINFLKTEISYTPTKPVFSWNDEPY
jgi:hypothetical protein